MKLVAENITVTRLGKKDQETSMDLYTEGGEAKMRIYFDTGRESFTDYEIKYMRDFERGVQLIGKYVHENELPF